MAMQPEETAPVELVGRDPDARRGRRRVVLWASVGAVAVVAAVVALVLPGRGTEPSAVPPPEPDRPVAVQVLPSVVTPGDVVTAVLVANEENDLTFGVDAQVERWDGVGWRRAGAVGLCPPEWGCASAVTDQLGAVNDIGLGASLGTAGSTTVFSTAGLTDGWYRLVLRAALDRGSATGLFEVRAGAPAGPPHPSTDGVRLLLDPTLVPREGGLARVAPLVPAGEDGTLTIDDIEAVDAALSPSALVQRWDGTGWLDVVELAVGARETELGAEWGAPVALPALEDGSYRLVRTRPGAPDAWGLFFVADGAPPLASRPPTDGSAPPSGGPETEGPDPEEPEPEGPGAEDVWAPDHPFCAEQAGRCLLEAWWRDVVSAAGIERRGGDHDVGLVLTDSVQVDQRPLWLTLVPAGGEPAGTPVLTVATTTQVGGSRVEAGTWADGADGRRLTCGGFVLATRSTDLEPAEIDAVVERIAGALTECPADVAALAARYPEYPPVP